MEYKNFLSIASALCYKFHFSEVKMEPSDLVSIWYIKQRRYCTNEQIFKLKPSIIYNGMTQICIDYKRFVDKHPEIHINNWEGFGI